MQFEFKNLGTIKEAQLEMGNLTVICGKNNTGKTYLTYGVWGVIASITLESSSDFIQDMSLYDIEKIKGAIKESKRYSFTIDKNSLEHIGKKYMNIIQNNMKSVFASNDSLFENSYANFNNEVKEYQHTLNFDNKIYSKSSFDDKYETVISQEGLTIHIDYSTDLKFKINAASDFFMEQGEITKEEISFREMLVNRAIDILITGFALRRPNFPTFLLPAQRDSIELFYKELDKNRSHLLEKLRTTRDLSLLDKESSRFPQPIEKLIDFARDLTRQVIKTESFLAKEHPELLKEIENLLGVTYEVSGDEVLIKDNKDKNSTQKIPAYMASTSVRSLMHLHFWLKHKAQKGDLLMIDEPELNLHPENQIKMARLFAKLVNAGIKVWITTHSDYIIKELNNCLMFSQEIENKKELLEELGYKENEILKRDDIRAYIARYDEKLEGCTVDKVEFDEYGMVMTTFDEQIDKINAITESLADAIVESKTNKQTIAE
ncbi:AAA family ATPase [Bernardetia sp. MNP-M8]|uniref:AAA family ATPase n=1 Tax=Bernardetia sp. MNP-M8 TaxID=3127470 RepID=UPI0030CBBDA2